MRGYRSPCFAGAVTRGRRETRCVGEENLTDENTTRMSTVAPQDPPFGCAIGKNGVDRGLPGLLIPAQEFGLICQTSAP